MMKRGLLARLAVAVLAVALLGVVSASHAQTKWTQLSLSTCKVDEFLNSRPNSDGRGVVIAVLDTGVDPSIPGLTQTPDGGVKVIDLQDFTGQGDIEIHRVHLDPADGRLIDHDENGSPIHYTIPSLPDSGSEERRFWFGYFDEANFVNSDVADLNDNGETDDRFPLFVTALAGDGDDQALMYIDTDLDRDFANEKPLQNYNEKFDTFTFHRDKPEEQIIPVTFAANIFLRKSKVVICYDDGAHGTHVAGIAAGYRINNQDGFNGIAPGAKVIGLKIGQNAIGSVSTTESIKAALEYAARFARERNVQVVCNLSFGVESVIEGDSDIDKFVDEFLRKNPYLVFCSSAGNEGPGLSSVGTPAAAAETIAVAAMLAADSGRDVMGYTMDEPVVTVFSSRGGELGKPDIAVPGWATSTVPRWVRRGDYWAGTSMASPYAAGLCAVLISDALSRDANAKVRACDIRRALQLTARPIANETSIGSGAGVPDLPEAAKTLRRLIDRAADDPILAYNVSTPCPHGHGGVAPAAYWRSTYFPTDEQQIFTITPVFAPGTDASAKTSFVRKFSLRSKSPWCRLPQKEIYLRGEQEAQVFVEYDASKLSKPGLYTGTVEAVHDGLVAFELQNTIIVPYRGDAKDDFALRFDGQTVNGWTPSRYFLAVPAGASAMKLTLTAPAGRESKASFERIYDPNGSRYRIRSNKLDTADGGREVTWSVTDDLIPGIWEVPVVADRPDKSWPFDLDVRFIGLHAEPAKIFEWSESPPEGQIVVTNMFERRLVATGAGRLEGFRKLEEDKFKGLKDTLTYTLTLDDSYDSVRLDLEMSKEAYATTTDIGVRVEVDDEEVLSDAFSNRRFRGTVSVPPNGDTKTVKLIINGGFAVADDKRETPITVRFDQLLAMPVPITVKYGDASQIDFIPGVPIGVDFALDSAPPATPEDLLPVGMIEFKERHSGDTALKVPIEIEE